MRLEPSLGQQKGQSPGELQPERSINSNSKSKKNRKKQKKAMQSVVQRLFLTCKDVFAKGGAGYVPPPEDVERLRSVLDVMKPEDVGLNPDLPYFTLANREGAPVVTYLHVYECNKFSIGIFCLPQSAVIPLHNHPGMTVFSKLLFGSMHIKSYDWVTDAANSTKENLNHSQLQQPPGTRLSTVKTDSDFIAPCNTSILYPADGGNMHCFTALTSCAVLDVLGPPYSDPDGRPCTYYREFPYTSFSGDLVAVTENAREKYAWLQEREKPDNFYVVGARYRGPQVG